MLLAVHIVRRLRSLVHACLINLNIDAAYLTSIKNFGSSIQEKKLYSKKSLPHCHPRTH